MIFDRVVYVLLLENGKYYVGRSGNIPVRLKQHFNKNGAIWTRKYKPIQVLDILEEKSLFTENNVTKELMYKYGIENVRGGSYCRVKLSESDLTTLTKEFYSFQDLCFLCGGNHFVKNCKKKVL